MKIGFIGCGNMARAILGGIRNRKLVPEEDLMASARTEATKRKIREELGIRAAEDNREAAAFADVLILAVKPVSMEDVIEEISEAVKPETIVVTLAPGKTLQWLDSTFGKPTKLIRTMPNTPALVGEGDDRSLRQSLCDTGGAGNSGKNLPLLRKDPGSAGIHDRRGGGSQRQLPGVCLFVYRGPGGRGRGRRHAKKTGL